MRVRARVCFVCVFVCVCACVCVRSPLPPNLTPTPQVRQIESLHDNIERIAFSFASGLRFVVYGVRFMVYGLWFMV